MEHLDDLESDFSALHRIDDMYALPGPRFFGFANRLSAYAGIMQARVLALADEQPGRSPAPTAPGTRGDTYIPKDVTAASIALDPVLGSLISVGKPE